MSNRMSPTQLFPEELLEIAAKTAAGKTFFQVNISPGEDGILINLKLQSGATVRGLATGDEWDHALAMRFM